MTVNESISLLMDGLIVATMTTSDSFKPRCPGLKDTRPAGEQDRLSSSTHDVTHVQNPEIFQHLSSQAKLIKLHFAKQRSKPRSVC